MRLLLTVTAAALIAAASAASAQTFSFTTFDNPADPTFNQLLGINDTGVIVGYFGSGAAGHPNIGYEIATPYTTFTANMQPGSIQTQATGINNAGITTGFWSPTNLGGGDANFGFIRQPTGTNFTFVSATDPLVSAAGAVDQALGINNNSIAVGFYLDVNGVSHGYTYNLVTAAYTAIKFSGATNIAATGINDNGQISGFFTAGKVTSGFVRNASGSVITKFTVPGTKFTQLLGINNAGVAVGFYMDKGGETHGLYYTPSNGNWTAVNDPNGAGGTVVNGINNMNQLVGFYTDAAGNTHGMLVSVTP